MKKQWTYNALSHSLVSDPITVSSNTFSAVNIPRFEKLSKQKREQSRDKVYSNYQHLGQKMNLNTYKTPDSNSLKEMPHYEFKQNPMRRDIDSLTQRIRELQNKFSEYDHRVDTLERSTRNTSKLTTTLEEFMRNQYADIKQREQLQERLATFEQALGHMSTIKADRKELESIEVGRYHGLNQRCNALEREDERVDGQIAEIHAKFQRMVGKIEASFLCMGQKYEEFIQSNIIKTIDHVNKLTQHYHIQIEQLAKDQGTMHEQLDTIQKAAVNQLIKHDRKYNFSSQLLGVSLPHIRLVQSLVIKDDRKPKGLNFFKQHIKEQHKDLIPSGSFAQSCSTQNTTFSDSNVLNNIYDSIDQPPSSNGSLDLSFQKVLYKLDSEYRLLDENDHYILTSRGEHIKLSEQQLSLLREHGIIS